MIYFSLIVFLINKLSWDCNGELSEIFGENFRTLLQIMMNSEFLLYIKKSKIKNNLIKNKKRNYSKRPTKEIDKEYKRLTSKDLVKLEDTKMKIIKMKIRENLHKKIISNQLFQNLNCS